MAKAVGPTIPRWRLGEELRQLREQAGISRAQIAKELECTVAKIHKLEQGAVGVSKLDLRIMLDLYKVQQRGELEELQALGKQRGWWAPLGRYLTQGQATFLGMESAATAIQTWQPQLVPGLLQTEAYARALMTGWPLTSEDVERNVRMRLQRQKVVWAESPPSSRFILDESVLLRIIDSPQTMSEQLSRLLDPPARSKIQILPLDNGAPHRVTGAIDTFEFAADQHTPVATMETPAGTLYVEDDRVDVCFETCNHLKKRALSPSDSATLIRDKIEGLGVNMEG